VAGGDATAADNRVSLHGTLVELDALRYTPAGIPIVKFRLSHESSQSEAGAVRKVGVEVAGVAFESEAKLLAAAKLGAQMSVTGFLDRKGRTSRQLVLHATRIEFKEG
jgi:primosomal replication protein N